MSGSWWRPTVCVPIRSGSKGAMRPPIRIATREAIMGHDEFVVGGLLALGAFHGVNPGMGWLFAVALGMQERRRSAVLAMPPLALGHGLAIAAAIAMAALIGAVVPYERSSGWFRLSCWLWGFRASSGTDTRAGSVCRWE